MDNLLKALGKVDKNLVNLAELVQVFQESTCKKNKCITLKQAAIRDDPDFLSLDLVHSISINHLSDFITDLSTNNDPTHLACIIGILNHIYCWIIRERYQNVEDSILSDFVLLSKRCLDATSFCPLPVENEVESVAKYKKIRKENYDLTSACLNFCTCIIISEDCKRNDRNKITNLAYIKEELSDGQKHILKCCSAKLFALACVRIGDQKWTTDELRQTCNDILQVIMFTYKCNSLSEVLSGKEDETGSPSQRGLMSSVLEELVVTLDKKAWKKNVLNLHALLWCIQNLKYPHLDKHISRVVPGLLLLIDDYTAEHKFLGILVLSHLLENVNPAELRLYNHDAVIYDALSLQLFSSEHEVHDATLQCLLKLLPMMHHKSEVVKGLEYSQWDKTFEKLVRNIELASKVHSELVLLKFMPTFIEKMGGNTIKHLETILRTFSLPIQGYGTDLDKKRLYTLEILKSVVKTCWPIISTYQKVILKLVLRLLIDFCISQSVMGKTSENIDIETQVCSVLILIKRCNEASVLAEFEGVTKLNLDKTFEPVIRVVHKVLQSKE